MAKKRKQHSCLRFYGGKNPLASKFWKLAPPHTRYCEPYCGGCSMLFARPDGGEGVSEFVNDIYYFLYNFWKTLQDEVGFQKFKRFIEATPFSQQQFNAAKNITNDSFINPIEIFDSWQVAAYFFIVNRQSRQGIGESFNTPTARLRRGMNEHVSSWLSAVEGLDWFHERLIRVEIRNQDAIEFINELDSEETFHYLDPPYVHETRNGHHHNVYKHEMTNEQHEQLLATLSSIKGKFMLSGYHSAMYDEWCVKNGYWFREFEVDNKASAKKSKPINKEVVWMNYDPDSVVKKCAECSEPLVVTESGNHLSCPNLHGRLIPVTAN